MGSVGVKSIDSAVFKLYENRSSNNSMVQVGITSFELKTL